jgi:adsorption protein B
LFPPGDRQLASAPLRRVALLIPLWKEHKVIRNMLEHNLAAIRYSRYDIIAGTYPNDPATQQAERAVSQRFANVHLAVYPHDGPTSKADCLNWAFQHMLLIEEDRYRAGAALPESENFFPAAAPGSVVPQVPKVDGERFDVVVTHDAEDLIHAEELDWINYYSGRFDFVQTPVLPLPSRLPEFTHGVYCDEFAENHIRDMTVRSRYGGFIPSAGVGTGFTRDALARGRIFQPALRSRVSYGRLFDWVAFIPPGMLAGVRSDFPRQNGHQGILSRPLAGRFAPTYPVGHGYCAAGVGAIRLAWKHA